MSNSILEALFSGKIIPWDLHSDFSTERKAIEEKILHEKQYFTEKMSPEDCKRFEVLDELYSCTAHEEGIDNCCHGFALGALLMMDVMARQEALLNGKENP